MFKEVDYPLTKTQAQIIRIFGESPSLEHIMGSKWHKRGRG
jgi:hypothetical protein